MIKGRLKTARIAHSGVFGILLVMQLMLSGQAWSGDKFIPQKPSLRVIVDNDFAGDPDGLAALAHQLLTPKTRTTLVTVSALNPQFNRKDRAPDSVKRGKAEADRLLELLDIDKIPVARGSEVHGTDTPTSDAARAIIEEAMRDDPLPLVFTCGGPLTNLAAALKLEPSIAEKMQLIWIGGGDYPDGAWEYNLATDIEAARYVFEQADIPIWQIPQSTYRQMQYSVAEMTNDLRPISNLTRWLYDQYTELPDFVEMGGSLTMGDHPLVLLSALSAESSRFNEFPARQIMDDGSYGSVLGHRKQPVRVFSHLDARLTYADFLALLRLQAQP